MKTDTKNKDNPVINKEQERESFSTQLKFLDELDIYINEKAAQISNTRVRDMYESDDTKEINTAFSKAQGEFPAIGYDKENPYFKNKYASFDSIVRAIRPVLCKYGLSVTQQTIITESGATFLKTRLRHNSGQWIETRARILPTKSDAQSYASALTYMKRYSFMALLNITTSDDSSDDDAERVMFDVRNVKAKGVALNRSYSPKEETNETITKEQIEELEYELAKYDDIHDMVLEGFKIQSLADMPKTKFLAASKRIREIKNAREGLTD